MKNLEIHIEELVLHGFAPGDYEGIRTAVENELTRLFTTNELPSSLHSNKNSNLVDAGEFMMQQGSKAYHVGNSIAGSVYKGIRNNRGVGLSKK